MVNNEKKKNQRGGAHPNGGRKSRGRQFSINARVSREAYELFMSWDTKSENIDELIRLHENDYPKKDIVIEYPYRISFFLNDEAYARYAVLENKQRDISNLIIAHPNMSAESTGVVSQKPHQVNVRISEEAFAVYSTLEYKSECIEKILLKQDV